VLGQHTADILREAGYSDEDIAGLQARRVVFGGGPGNPAAPA